MDECTSPVFPYQEQALGTGNVKLAVFDQDEDLDFISDDDIILLRSVDKHIIDVINNKGVKSTSEDYDIYMLALDKVALAEFLVKNDIPVPRKYTMDEVVDGRTYYVKPRKGSECKELYRECSTRVEIESLIQAIANNLQQDAVIEDCLSSEEYTVACLNLNGQLYSFVMNVKEPNKVLKREEHKKITTLALDTFRKIGIKHHARIDIKSNCNGKYFVIDVNLIPSLGPRDKWSKCFAHENISYRKSLKMVVNSAT